MRVTLGSPYSCFFVSHLFILGWHIIPSSGRPNKANTSSIVGVIKPSGNTNELRAGDQNRIIAGRRTGLIGTPFVDVIIASRIRRFHHLSSHLDCMGSPNLSKLIVMFRTKFQDRLGLTILPTLYFVFDKQDEQQYYVETKGTSVLGNF